MASQEIATFFDTRSIGRVTEMEAMNLIHYARPIISCFTKDSLADPQPYDLGKTADVLDPETLQFNAPHVLLLSRLPIIKGAKRERDGVCLRRQDQSFTAIVTIPHSFTTDPQLNDILGTITHELAHGKGIGHCATSSCVMFPYGNGHVFNRLRPFCGEHALTRKK